MMYARNLAISAQRQPAYAVSGLAALGLELEEVEPRVEEQIELLDPYAEKFREKEVPSLVEQHKD